MIKIKYTTIILFLIVFCHDAISQNSNKETKKVIVLDEVNVIKKKSLSSLTSSTLTVIPKEVIDKSKKTSVLSLISEMVPGAFVTERGTLGYGVYSGSAGSISFRGVGGSPTTQVLVAIDGQPQYMGINGHHLPDAYRTSNVERIEVIRGPASTLYGSNAMGGVINIITSDPKDGLNTSLDASYGTYNTQKYLLSNSFKKKNFSSFISVNHDRTDGHRPNSAFHLTGGDMKLLYQINDHYKVSTNISVSGYQSTDPGPISAPTTTDTLTADVTRLSTILSLENNHLRSRGAFQLSYNYGHHDLYYGWNSKDHSIGANAYQMFSLLKNNLTTVGLNYSRYGGIADDRSKPKFNLDEFIDESAGYIIVEQNIFDKLTLNAGLRINYSTQFDFNYIPQAAVSYKITPTSSAKLSVAKGFRNPTLRELYIFAANDSLMPESMINYELSYKYVSKNYRFNAEVAAYVSKGDNIIETEFVNNIPKYSYNSGDFENIGFELMASYKINDDLNLSANYSYIDYSKPLLATPRGMLNVSTDYSFWKMNLMANVQYIDKIYTQVKKQLEHESYVLANLMLSCDVARGVHLYFKLNNLLDTDYQMTYNYPMPGRTCNLGISVNIGK